MIRKLANSLAAFVATGFVCPVIAVVTPFLAAWWVWNETDEEP